MSTLSQFFASSQIKSIQRSTISIPGSATSSTVTITSVNTAKTILNFLGATWNLTNASVPARVALTNSTTITATRDVSVGFVSIVSFEVIEFN